MAETRFGTFDDLMDQAVPERRPVARRLREMVLDVDPEATEVVRLGDNAATYGLGPKKMSEGYAYIMPHMNWVNLGFYNGAALDYPAGLLEGTGKKLRHVKVLSMEDAEKPVLRSLVAAALAERKKALGR